MMAAFATDVLFVRPHCNDCFDKPTMWFHYDHPGRPLATIQIDVEQKDIQYTSSCGLMNKWHGLVAEIGSLSQSLLSCLHHQFYLLHFRSYYGISTDLHFHRCGRYTWKALRPRQHVHVYMTMRPFASNISASIDPYHYPLNAHPSSLTRSIIPLHDVGGPRLAAASTSSTSTWDTPRSATSSSSSTVATWDVVPDSTHFVYNFIS